jgi:hypothetical protein
MPSLPVRNADLRSMSKCHRIPECSFINAPVVVQYCIQKKEFAVFIAPIQARIAHQNRGSQANYDGEGQHANGPGGFCRGCLPGVLLGNCSAWDAAHFE